MRIRGRICDGKVVLEGQQVLPEGTEVIVEVREPSQKTCQPIPDEFPIFQSKNPGSLNLSNQRIAEILEDEELSAGH